MNKSTNPYTWYLISKNSLYIGACILIIIGMLMVITFGSQGIEQRNIQIAKLKDETQKLENRKHSVDLLASEPDDQISTDLNLMIKLIPNAEEYFSMIEALERLSLQTGFLIQDYHIDLAKNAQNKIAIDVTGEGNSEAFLEFLNNYQVGGGRLITAEQISLNPLNVNSITLSLNFYNKQTTNESPKEQIKTENILASLDKIKSKIQFDLVSADIANTAIQDYPTKTNPF